MELFRGVYPALVTPFTPTGQFDADATARLIDFHLNAKVDGFYVSGTTGEGLLQDVATRAEMARFVVNHVRGRAQVIAHIGAMSTDDAIDLSRRCAEAGVDGLSAVPPVFYRMGFESVMHFYRQLATATRLPFLVYYIPSLSGVAYTLAEVGQLLEIPQVVGLKFSDYNLFLLHSLREHFPEATIFSGNDEVLLPALVMGAHGSIGLTLNFMPAAYVGIYHAYREGNLAEAQQIQFAANRITEIVIRYGVCGACKAILKMIGLDCGLPRGPVPSVEGARYDQLNQELEAVGLFTDPRLGPHAIRRSNP